MNAKEFETLFKQHKSFVYQRSYAILKDTELAKDVVQEAFEKLWENRRRNIINKREYLFITARNMAIHKIARQNTRARHTEIFVNEQPITYELSDNENVLEKLFASAISKLTDRQREVYKLHNGGKSHEFIANRLKISPWTVANLMKDAHRNVRKYIQQHYKLTT